MSSTNWVKVGSLDSIPIHGARRLCRNHMGKPVAVFRTAEDKVFALIDECPHKKGPLSEGIIAGETVACPLHGIVIGLTDGVAALPDEGSTQALPIRVVNGEIFVHLPELVCGAAV